ncbi:histamine H2 receptor-like [Amphiura filiformis]|uniref:histamine H2 receptor-like n=1 Tax=Amphiura filiformis TaxID=82378 RepID=UPI003B21736D
MYSEEPSTLFNILAAIIVATIFIVIIIGNLFVLLTLRQVDSSGFNDVTKLFMKSLTISDLLVGIFIVLPNIGKWANGGEWPSEYGVYFPAFYLKVHIVVLISGLLSLLVITVERYVAVSWSLRYQTLLTPKKARMIVAAVWFMSIIFALAAKSSSNDVSSDADNNATVSQSVSSDYKDGTIEQRVVTEESTTSLWANFFLLVAVPITTIIVLSIKLYIIARKHARRINDQQRQFIVAKKDYKGAVTFFIVAGGFAVAWLPNFILSLYLSYTNSTVDPVLYFFVRIFIYSNSWWNVCIYYFRNRSFRHAARRKLIMLGLRCRWMRSNAVGEVSESNTASRIVVPSIEIIS